MTTFHSDDFMREIHRLIAALNSRELTPDARLKAKNDLKELLFTGKAQAVLADSMVEGMIDQFTEAAKRLESQADRSPFSN